MGRVISLNDAKIIYSIISKKLLAILFIQIMFNCALLILFLTIRNHDSNTYYSKSVYKNVKVEVGYKRLNIFGELFEKLF